MSTELTKELLSFVNAKHPAYKQSVLLRLLALIDFESILVKYSIS